MNNVIHPIHGLNEAITVAYIADEIAHAILMEVLLHLELLEFIAGENDDLMGCVPIEQGLDILLAKRTRAAGDQDGGVIEHFS